jgi:NSS family neurotransmitter:Na+ symporter
VSEPERAQLPGAELFSSRWALLLTTLGMAVGTGNIWRFPRIIAKCGGGAFLIPWLIFLFAWSIPLLVLELGMGRSSRRGCVGAFAHIAGPRLGWLGSFVAFCCTAIMFYYAVVAGWCIKYLLTGLQGGLHGVAGDEAEQVFLDFASSPEPIVYQVLAMGVAGLVVLGGVVRGIERANKLLIPSLFVLLLMAMLRSLTLPGAGDGLRFLFTVDWALLGDANTWIEALCQSAWSTGAGWGLMLTYGVYVSRKEAVVSNAVITGLGNNSASIIAAVAIIPAVFALAPMAIAPERLAELGGVEGFLTAGGPASTGLTFIWIPALFEQMPGGSIFTALFFLTLFFAALSSLIAMVELAARVLIDMGIGRKPAVLAVAGTGIALGIPSAVNLEFFQNQDWAWGLGLMLSGLFVALAVMRYGPARFRRDTLAPGEARRLGRGFDLWITIAIPAQFLIMLGWWFSQSISWDPQGWWNPLGTFTVGTVVLQWAVALGAFIALNRWLVGRSKVGESG